MEKFGGKRDRIHEDRELILDLLNQVFPRGIEERRLLRVLLELPRPVDQELALRDLAMLEGLGLAMQFVPKHPVTEDPLGRHWKLTPAGVIFIEKDKDWAKVEAL